MTEQHAHREGPESELHQILDRAEIVVERGENLRLHPAEIPGPGRVSETKRTCHTGSSPCSGIPVASWRKRHRVDQFGTVPSRRVAALGIERDRDSGK
jgi:hypothetical protein